MTRITAIGILIVAAGLEAGGDALMRVGLHTSALWQRLALFSVAGIVLFAYGWTVNAPPGISESCSAFMSSSSSFLLN
jgi:hypothetical protein